MNKILEILSKEVFQKHTIMQLLDANEKDALAIFKQVQKIRTLNHSNKVWLRGLIEYSNICDKNCNYCGIRRANKKVKRYTLSDSAVLACASHAYKNNYGSVVLQSGERSDNVFIDKISKLLKEIKKLSNEKLGITLSCGEQSRETYQQWFDSGAHRYLLRFETSSQSLYNTIHPNDANHNFLNRIQSLKHLKEIGYQVGSGMMIGIPEQGTSDIAADLLFLKELDVDMVGLGPFIEHPDTPLYCERHKLFSKKETLALTLKTIAVLRLLMPDINIAAATALDSLDPKGRLKALQYGANILMPNLTPQKYREAYFLYNKKPQLLESDDLLRLFKNSPELCDLKIDYGKWGDSLHFQKRKE